MGTHGRMLSLAKHSKTLWRGPSTQDAKVALKQPLTLFNLPGGDAQFRVISDQPGVPQTDADAGIFGFRHLFGDPRPEETFNVDRNPIDDSDPASRSRLAELMERLARRMSVEFPFEAVQPVEPGAGAQDNTRVPSGYTYLLQLAGHDMMHSTVSLAITEDSSVGFANGRLSPLNLETIYGGGPDLSPFIYEQDGNSGSAHPAQDTRSRMRVGRARPNDGPVSAACPFRDIARTGVMSGGGPLTGNKPLLTEPLIADPRNDDHAILSQLTNLFHRLHNALLDKIDAQKIPPDTYSRSSLEAAYRRFFAVRFAVTLIYRSIVRNDLLKAVLSPAVFDLYKDADGPILDQPDGRIPLEFSHGAYRFGHAMVRPGYSINNDAVVLGTIENLAQNSTSTPADMPIQNRWVAQWSRFFFVGGAARNFSRRIGPCYVGPLSAISLFPPIEPSGRGAGLLYRDLLSGAYAGLWSVPGLFSKIRAEPKFGPLGLPDFNTFWKPKLLEWLGTKLTCNALQPPDIVTLSENPPLLPFVLLEAAQETAPGGTHLGTLGSIIIAEAFMGAFKIDKAPLKAVTSLPLLEGLSKIGSDVLRTPDAFAFITHDISTMPELIAFMADDLGLGTEQPPFM